MSVRIRIMVRQCRMLAIVENLPVVRQGLVTKDAQKLVSWIAV